MMPAKVSDQTEPATANDPLRPVDPDELLSFDDIGQLIKSARSSVRELTVPELAKKRGIPLLRTVSVGRRKPRVRGAEYLRWLDELAQVNAEL